MPIPKILFRKSAVAHAGSNTPLHGLVLGLETSLLGVSLSVARPLSLRSLSTMPLILLGGVQTGD